MNKDAKNENYRTLASLLNIEDKTAKKILNSSVLITGGDQKMNDYLTNILSRTFETIDHNEQNRNYCCEMVIGNTKRKTVAKTVYLGVNSNGELQASVRHSQNDMPHETPDFLKLLLSYYASSLVVKQIFGDDLPFHVADNLVLNIKKIISTPEVFTNLVHIEEAYLAGVGAIGNAFLYALNTFNVSGKIIVCDPDSVSGGNLNRCLFFNESDIDKKKVDVICTQARELFPNLALVPFPDELSKCPEKHQNDKWLKRLIVGVDSRRARRTLQSEIPNEVFDSSTTGIEEFVIHYNKQPLEGAACLGCIYHKEEIEQAHEKHVAEVLGVSIDDVNQMYVNEIAAKAIGKKYNIKPENIISLAYDTLFKQLCGEGVLKTKQNRQVLAPFAFISGLAGAFLALKFIESLLGYNMYNYWRISPWREPNIRLQQNVKTSSKCEFCNDPNFIETSKALWEN